jgi:FkbM family methyltransferase
MYILNPKKQFIKLDPESFFINDPNVGAWMFSSGIPEWGHIQWCIDNFINSEVNFIDIGAHIGTYSWTIAPHAKHTYSFECNPVVYNCMCANIFLKDLNHKITAYSFGLSSDEGEATYYVRSKDGGGNGFTFLGEKREESSLGTLKLPLKRLDDLNIENIGLIKIDVEGHEIHVLKGALKTLEKNNWPPILFESWDEWRETREHMIPASKLRSELFQFLNNIGYSIVPVGNNSEIFLAEFNRNS